jgi:hypothetical protein
MTFKNNRFYCNKCSKDLEAVGGINIYWVVKELKIIKPYGIDAPDYIAQQ